MAVAGVSMGLWLAGKMKAQSFEGDTSPDDPEFRLMTMFGGREVVSRSRALRSAEVRVTAGGMDLDLSEAALDPEGGHLDISVTGGGLRVTVPAQWRVYVTSEVDKGGVDTDLPDPESLPDDAPTLTVAAVVRGGGIYIEAAAVPAAAD